MRKNKVRKFAHVLSTRRCHELLIIFSWGNAILTKQKDFLIFEMDFKVFYSVVP